ncbi:MAG: hypothetical protein A2268_07715 [Candidatus Raymondbacteria bacterium RifOxyA12_full_50_37]|uniref:Radical SAM core domain-containing protein n=1 Tax=Candidatus Raymondbacteria bacterium RIFOXYD12_FULL_49_13 TaxID=1817890 RepID=A0A1F7F4Z3_UNCRA|nr:MAG: hypothetical protein A2248_05325 [Candidatus Raymondbacteria bacterium RIFOXYA2_FULL_49_16]OGJ90127.1 MAG: hypothetical protein A2268_07715 [Candidatus Raymondbacteria bacterium RifOxyA12_full_50_37]OGJ92126.1 MAG: hypothetical protein A2350_08635 [Candidatus Raymondbacteria bacterium RifOxyB12_full_50_8]OGJ97705.1 MAG: hypothetical protein A2453_09685 [Candidatus Raymondbacteria bacterium RIFOXYC2_FULL_50_21]OGK01730.1 MAG: hypothetical protein A2519_22930 [Candidatus Raymondbacteria b
MDINRKLKIFKCAFQSGATPFASLFVTRVCNRSCSFCNVHRQPGKELSTDEWKKAVDALYSWGVRNVSINGGEPFLRKDIGELVSYASRQKGCVTWLFTNGTLLDNGHLAQLKDLDFLCASLNGLDDQTPAAISRFLGELKKCETFGITPALLVVITAENVDSILAIARECVGQGILFDFGILQDVGSLFSAQTGPQKPSYEKLKKLFTELAALRAKTGKILPSYPLLRKAADFYRKNNWKCPTAKNPFIVVNADGMLMPCQEFATNLSIFDITSLKDKRWIKAKKLVVDQCRGCSWTCYYQKTFRNPFDLLHESVTLLKF